MPLTHISRFAILIQCDSKFYTLSLPPPDLATLPFIHTYIAYNPWSSVLEGDKQPDQANSKTCMECCHACAAYFW